MWVPDGWITGGAWGPPKKAPQCTAIQARMSWRRRPSMALRRIRHHKQGIARSVAQSEFPVSARLQYPG